MSRQRAKGTRWESAIVAYLRGQGFPHAERRALTGTADRGDLTGIPGVVVEAKNCRRHEWAAWLDEAGEEGVNAGADVAVVWAHRQGRPSPGEGYVAMTGERFVWLLRAAGYGNEIEEEA